MVSIEKIAAREILDSRGNPTIEVEVTAGGILSRAAAPSGASTGIHEALELRDGDKKRYGGKGVLKAVANVNGPIASALKGKSLDSIEALDREMIALDGTPNKSKFGANAIVATSLALAKAAATSQKKSLYAYLGGKILPVPMMNVLNGGKHAGNRLAIQEFMIMPVGAKSFSEALRMGAETYHILGKLLSEKYGPSARNVGDEGGYAPDLASTSEALDCLVSAIEKAGYSKEIKLALDPAASSFYDEKTETYAIDGKNVSGAEMIDIYSALVSKYPIVSIEDGLHEEDFAGFAEMTKKLGSKVQIVGDDLLVTNTERIKTAIAKKSVTALLLKVNQIGTLTESIEAARMSYQNGMAVVVSHRSGETEDATIADIAVGIESGQIKTGSLARTDRTAKYNQLLRIEQELGSKGVYAGTSFRSPKRSFV